jgi:hypothetical protein
MRRCDRLAMWRRHECQRESVHTSVNAARRSACATKDPAPLQTAFTSESCQSLAANLSTIKNVFGEKKWPMYGVCRCMSGGVH